MENNSILTLIYKQVDQKDLESPATKIFLGI